MVIRHAMSPPRVSKARKEYTCFVCEKKIDKGSKYLLKSLASSDMGQIYSKISTYNPYGHDYYLSMKMCNESCYDVFCDWVSNKQNKKYVEITNRYYKHMFNAILDRCEDWIAKRNET